MCLTQIQSLQYSSADINLPYNQIIPQWFFKKWDARKGVDWTDLAHDRDK